MAVPDDFFNNAINEIADLIASTMRATPTLNFRSLDEIFDKASTRQSVTEEFTPYYNEVLKDFTEGVEIKRRRTERDTERGITFLEQESGDKEEIINTTYDQAIRRANTGFSGRGLIFSGERNRALRELGRSQELELGGLQRQTAYTKTGLEFGKSDVLEDLTRGQTQFERDLEREKKFSIEQSVLNRRNEALQEFQ